MKPGPDVSGEVVGEVVGEGLGDFVGAAVAVRLGSWSGLRDERAPESTLAAAVSGVG